MALSSTYIRKESNKGFEEDGNGMNYKRKRSFFVLSES